MSRMKRMAEQGIGPRPKWFDDALMRAWYADGKSPEWVNETVFKADGSTYDPAQDQRRLGKQAQRVWNFMSASGKGNFQSQPNWWTLRDISEATDCPESSVSARLRDFRKPRFGSHTVERRRRKGSAGTWEYRLKVNSDDKG